MRTTTVNVKLSVKEDQALRLIVQRQNDVLGDQKIVDISPEMVIRGLIRAEARAQGIEVDKLPGTGKSSGPTTWTQEQKQVSAPVLRLRAAVEKLTKTHKMSQSGIAIEIRKDAGLLSSALHGNRSDSAAERLAFACEDLLRRVERGGVSEIKEEDEDEEDDEEDEDQEEEEVPSTERPKSDPEEEGDDDDDGIPLDDLSGDDEDFSP